MLGYDVLVFLHVVLFAYWLGADLGVHISARFAIRSDLPLDERIRFLQLVLIIDLGVELAIAFIVPLGLTLAWMSGLASMSGFWLLPAWLAGLAWYVVIWKVHLLDIRGASGHPAKPRLEKAERLFRMGFLVLTAGMALASLAGYGPLAAHWLMGKSLLYALAMVLVTLLRWELNVWGVALEKLASSETADEANAMIMAAHYKGRWYAWSLWLVVATAAFLGVAKPF